MPSLRADVSLVPLGLEHAERTLAWVSDPAVARGLGLRDPQPSLDKTRDWITRAQADPTVRAFAVLRAGAHVGNVVLDRIDPYLQTAHLSVYIGPAEARGAGVGRTAVWQAVRCAFEELRLHKVWLTVHAENAQAAAAYRSVGFVLEGTLRDEFLLDGRRVAALYLGLLRSEFVGPPSAASPESAP